MLVKVGLQIANIDCKMTTKEVKEIKNFSDNFMQYHNDLENQVLEELVKIRLEAQFRRSINRNQNKLAESLQMQAQLREGNDSHRDFFGLNKQNSSQPEEFKVESRVISTIQSAHSYKSSQSQQSFQSCQSFPSENGSSEDEFFDAVDHFD